MQTERRNCLVASCPRKGKWVRFGSGSFIAVMALPKQKCQECERVRVVEAVRFGSGLIDFRRWPAGNSLTSGLAK